MSLAGNGAVAIWHDIAAEGRDAFYAWHGEQHMPERVGISGFLRGRRYVAVTGQPEFFNLYETESASTVTSPEYLARLNAPTPWTVATVPHFRRVARSLCAVAASFGEGQGGLVATYRYAVADNLAAAHRRRLLVERLPALAVEPGIAGCHLLVADAEASAVETVEKRVRTERNEIPRWVLLVEGWGDVDSFRTSCESLLGDGTFTEATEPPALGIYRLQNSRCRLPGTVG